MSLSRSPCNDERLLELINDSLDDDLLELMLIHIEKCERCRSRMDELSAESYHWQKTVGALTDSQSNNWQVQFSLDGSPSAARRNPLSAQELSFKARSVEELAKQLFLPPSHPEMLGRLGRYEVERLIGSGGMGMVFKAFDTELNRPVAIKVLAPHLASCGSARQRFAREARAAAAVVNEHVVPIHNVESGGETPFLVMKYVDGESLQARLDREGPLEVDEILRIGMQVAIGLTAAHQQGLVHRDIKPGNILLERGIERALITDFGLARAVDDAHLTSSGFHAGTPQYMSPEQVAGNTVDCSSDLFSLGSVLYVLCTGRPPFRAENCYGVMKRIAEDTPRPIREINPRIPPWLECIVSKLHAKRPDQRLPSAALASQVFAECLMHVQNSAGGPLPKVVAAWMNASKQVRDKDTTGSNLASRMASGLYESRRLIITSMALTFLAALGVMQFIPYIGSEKQDLPAIGPSLTQPKSTALDSLPSTSQPDQSKKEKLTSETDWDAAIQAAQLLQVETNELEARVSQDLVP